MITEQRTLKKAKLRHAEYYDFQKVQDDLYAKSSNEYVFKNLIDIITRPENIKLAYRNLKSNKGSHTAGTDKRTIEYLARMPEEKLVSKVQQKFRWYEPQSVRRVEIPKGEGKTRPLGIPTIMDRLIQQCVLQVLEPICEARFHDSSYGFRPNRSQEQAIALAEKYMQQSHLHFVVDIDIKGFFDSVSHGKLLKQLWALGIRDKRLLSIISSMLKAEVAEIGFPEKGTPQGGIISPLLSNVVLNELDRWIASQWENIPTKHPYYVQIHKNGSENKGTKYRALRSSSNLKEMYSVRFADDFKIFTNNYSDAVKIFNATKQWLSDRLGLETSEEKSKVICLREKYSNFLGFKHKVIKRAGQKGKVRYVVKSRINDKALKRIKTRIPELIYDIENSAGEKGKEYKAVCAYNSYILGMHSYYRIATMVYFDINPIAFQVHKSLKARLKERVKSASEVKERRITVRMPVYVKQKYGDSRQLKYVGGNALVPVGYVQYKTPLNKKKCVNSYTKEGREEIHKDLSNVDTGELQELMRHPIRCKSIEFNDNRLSLYSAQQGKCAVSGIKLTSENIYCHHIVSEFKGGDNNYKNLILVTKEVDSLLHEKNPIKVEELKEKLCLTEKQLEKVAKLRKSCLG